MFGFVIGHLHLSALRSWPRSLFLLGYILGCWYSGVAIALEKARQSEELSALLLTGLLWNVVLLINLLWLDIVLTIPKEELRLLRALFHKVGKGADPHEGTLLVEVDLVHISHREGHLVVAHESILRSSRHRCWIT